MSNQSFRSLGVRPQVVDALAARGITSPFPIQERVLPDAIAGSDVLAKSPTGSGKTLAFGLALIERTSPGGTTPSVLVLVPTRELAAQVTDELRAPARVAGLKVASVYGGVPLGRLAVLFRLSCGRVRVRIGILRDRRVGIRCLLAAQCFLLGLSFAAFPDRLLTSSLGHRLLSLGTRAHSSSLSIALARRSADG